MVNQQSSIFYSDHGHCLQIHHLLKLFLFTVLSPDDRALYKVKHMMRKWTDALKARWWRTGCGGATWLLVFWSIHQKITAYVVVFLSVLLRYFYSNVGPYFLIWLGNVCPCISVLSCLPWRMRTCLRDVSKWKMIQFDITVGLDAASIMHNAYKNVQFLCLIQILQMKH